MSTTSWSTALSPALTAEHFPKFLASLVRADHRDRSVLSILGLASLQGVAHIQAICPPRTALCLDETLIASLEAAGVIYPLHDPHVADSYFVEYIAEHRSLWLKYQQIIGSRLLIAMSEEQAARFEKAVRDLHPRLMTGPSKAVDSDAGLLAEIGLLSAQGRRIELPRQRLAYYGRIKAILLSAGGTYARNGFTFASACDLETLLAQLRAGAQPNPKKARQAYYTPAPIAAATVARAGDLHGRRVLEPSAGEGVLADEARAAGAEVVAVENYGPSAQILRDKGFQVIERDFLTLTPADIGCFDAVIGNPPFSRGQDISHVIHMWGFLHPGGVLVSLMSPGWRTGRSKTELAFQTFATDVGADIEALPAGTFKVSGTHVASLRIRMLKPLDVDLECGR
ncbi:MAG: SAM-dependent methyltransferase [Azonexaceae bacterium]|nr:SAM-dependent methyltransferase [Azonexaceae bacterium]